MNKRLILIIVLCVATLFLVAEGNMKYGIKAGLNIATIGVSEDDIEYDPTFDFAIGGFLEYMVNPTFAIQPELLYTRKGAFNEDDFSEITWNLDYLQIPVLAKYIFAEQYGIYAGPAIAFLMTSEAEVDMKSSKATVDMKDYTNSTEFALVFGAEYNYNQIVFDLRYDLGLTKINDDEGDIDEFNRTFSFLVGYKF